MRQNNICPQYRPKLIFVNCINSSDPIGARITAFADPTTGKLRGPGAITPVDPAKLDGAKKATRTDRRRLPPFYWAAFVLSGDWR
jgi:hypothetical protein